jgi:hypothetical protein
MAEEVIDHFLGQLVELDDRRLALLANRIDKRTDEIVEI